jgi:hypothetical protein
MESVFSMRSAPRLYALKSAVSGDRERELLVSECPLERTLVEGVRSFILLKRRLNLKTRKSLRKNKSIVMGPDKAQNQDLLCWRRPAAI